MKWLNNILFSLQRFINQTRKYPKVVYVDDHPNELIPPGTLIVVTGCKYLKWLIFKCPCGCGDEYQLPLNPKFDPYWKVSEEKGVLSVQPSIHAKKPRCGAHFWIKGNTVHWAEPCPSIFSHW